MKICKGWLQALLSSTPHGFAARSRVLARPVSLAQTGELASRLDDDRLNSTLSHHLGHPGCNTTYSFPLFYGLLPGFSSLLRKFCFFVLLQL